MKKALLITSLLAMAGFSKAQITIHSNIIPAAGDSFLYSNPVDTNISTATGANMTWDFSTMTPVAQGTQSWKTVMQANTGFLLFGIPSGAFGFKLLDSLSFAGLTVYDPYTFFLKHTSGTDTSLNAVAYGITLNSIPVAALYQDEDEWFKFPLNYNDHDSTTYMFSANLLGNSLKGVGYRNTYVDGWGTIKTPYYTTAVSCLRIRSEVNEIDSITYNGTSLALPRQSVDYYWMTQNDKFPALWMNATIAAGMTIPTFTRYRDVQRQLGIGSVPTQKVNISTYPNPSTDGIFNVTIPAAWHGYSVEVFDMTGKLVLAQSNKAVVDLGKQPAGQYIIRTSNGADQLGFSLVQKL